MKEKNPNVIVIATDTFRPDHIAANGHPWIKTPELDDLLAKSITFDRATVSSFPTIPMRTDWLTGRFGHPRHGWRNLHRSAITLPEILSEHGYTTQLIADTTHLLRAEFWKPFNHFHFERGHEGDVPFSRLNDPIVSNFPDRSKTRVELGNHGGSPPIADVHVHTNHLRYYEEDHHAVRLADNVCRWIEDNNRGGPFMLWTDFFDVHEPWTPPQYLVDMYDPDYDGLPMIHPNYGPADAYSPEELHNLRAHYAAVCTVLSKQVGRIVRMVEDTGLLDNTVLVFMSDHGMYLGERGRTGKSLISPDIFDVFPFHPEIAHTCWSMHIPKSLGLKTLDAGTHLQQVIQAPDLTPTVLDLCGIKAPAKAQIEGESLVPWLTGARKDEPRKINITTSTTNISLAEGTVKCRRPTITDGKWTLLIKEPPEPASPELYHIADDPGQTTDVFSLHSDEAKRLHSEFLTWLTEHDGDAATLDRLSAQNAGL